MAERGLRRGQAAGPHPRTRLFVLFMAEIIKYKKIQKLSCVFVCVWRAGGVCGPVGCDPPPQQGAPVLHCPPGPPSGAQETGAGTTPVRRGGRPGAAGVPGWSRGAWGTPGAVVFPNGGGGASGWSRVPRGAPGVCWRRPGPFPVLGSQREPFGGRG